MGSRKRMPTGYVSLNTTIRRSSTHKQATERPATKRAVFCVFFDLPWAENAYGFSAESSSRSNQRGQKGGFAR